jgi:hypothetical protein
MGLLAMAEDNPFDVIRDAIFSAHVDHAHTGDAGLTCDPVYESNADLYARAVLLQIVRHIPEPADEEE